MQEMTCRRCGEIKELIKFLPCKKSRNGRQTLCQICVKDINRFGGKRRIVLERDGNKCVQCGMTSKEHFNKWKRSLTIDHKDKLGRNSKIKNNSLNNLQTLCLSCHGRKDRLMVLAKTACRLSLLFLLISNTAFAEWHQEKISTGVFLRKDKEEYLHSKGYLHWACDERHHNGFYSCSVFINEPFCLGPYSINGKYHPQICAASEKKLNEKYCIINECKK